MPVGRARRWPRDERERQREPRCAAATPARLRHAVSAACAAMNASGIATAATAGRAGGALDGEDGQRDRDREEELRVARSRMDRRADGPARSSRGAGPRNRVDRGSTRAHAGARCPGGLRGCRCGRRRLGMRRAGSTQVLLAGLDQRDAPAVGSGAISPVRTTARRRSLPGGYTSISEDGPLPVREHLGVAGGPDLLHEPSGRSLGSTTRYGNSRR